jgi:hypothetical protein
MSTILTFPNTLEGFRKWLEIVSYLCDTFRPHTAGTGDGLYYVSY